MKSYNELIPEDVQERAENDLKEFASDAEWPIDVYNAFIESFDVNIANSIARELVDFWNDARNSKNDVDILAGILIAVGLTTAQTWPNKSDEFQRAFAHLQATVSMMFIVDSALYCLEQVKEEKEQETKH